MVLRASVRSVAVLLVVSALSLMALVSGSAQDAGPKATYDQIKSFALTGGTAAVDKLSLKRDRVEMVFTGTFFFAAPVGGKVTGAVFVGDGTVRAEAPPSEFERDNLKRMLGADVVESDFKTAVLRFTDDTFQLVSASRRDGPATPQAQRLAAESETRFLKETGANLSSRLGLSMANGETPGVFVAQFDGGRRGQFTYLLDEQGRIPVAAFRLNGGEKGLIFAHENAFFLNEVWMAFYSLDDYARKVTKYSDANALVDITHYLLNLDLRNFDKAMGLVARMAFTTTTGNVRAIPFQIGESLSRSRDDRLKRQLRVKNVKFGDSATQWVQEDWEGGFTVFLPKPAAVGEQLVIEVEFEGDFIDGIPQVPECFYPLNNVTWLPRHGDLDRATFDLKYRHRQRDRIASIGTRVEEAPDPEDPSSMVTRYQMKEPVALAVFAIGPWERKVQQVTWESGGKSIPLEFNTVPPRVTRNYVSALTATRGISIKHEFMLAELDNAVRYFSAYFGRYPYETFGAAFHPFNFGQGFPTMLMLPPADEEDKHGYAFIAHETGHQWWGNIVAWRSYRDQWLSEGFAEYSGILYAGKRDREKAKAAADLIKEARETLLNPPRTTLGVGKGRLNDIGPMILGLRLNTSKTLGAYSALIYDKGALVLRMLHFLFSDPTTTNDAAFVAMMTDFVERFRNKAATTEEFAAVASEHFARTPIARKFGLRDLSWFFRQWVFHTELPTYTLEYELKPQPDGSIMATGVVKQDNAGPDWMMVLPVVFTFDANQEARTTVRVQGASTPFELKLPMKPTKVALDPGSWILSEKTVTRGK